MAHTEKATAFVLRTTEFSETSCVVTLFTREHGLLTALAKGARRPKSPFEVSLDLMNLLKIVFIPKPQDQLALLTEAKLERRFRGSEHGLAALYGGFHVVELLRETAVPGDPTPDLFDLADETLAGLASGEPAAARTLRFEAGALRATGHLPSWTRCVETGQPAPLEGVVRFDLEAGGVTLRPPPTGSGSGLGSSVMGIPAGTLKLLEVFSRSDDESWRKCRLDRRSWEEARRLLDAYWCWLFGFRPRMLQHLGRLAPTRT